MRVGGLGFEFSGSGVRTGTDRHPSRQTSPSARAGPPLRGKRQIVSVDKPTAHARGRDSARPEGSSCPRPPRRVGMGTLPRQSPGGGSPKVNPPPMQRFSKVIPVKWAGRKEPDPSSNLAWCVYANNTAAGHPPQRPNRSPLPSKLSKYKTVRVKQ